MTSCLFLLLKKVSQQWKVSLNPNSFRSWITYITKRSTISPAVLYLCWFSFYDPLKPLHTLILHHVSSQGLNQPSDNKHSVRQQTHLSTAERLVNSSGEILVNLQKCVWRAGSVMNCSPQLFSSCPVLGLKYFRMVDGFNRDLTAGVCVSLLGRCWGFTLRPEVSNLWGFSKLCWSLCEVNLALCSGPETWKLLPLLETVLLGKLLYTRYNSTKRHFSSTDQSDAFTCREVSLYSSSHGSVIPVSSFTTYI